MSQKNKIFKCGKCGVVVEVISADGKNISCCGENMELVIEQTEELGMEKHRPVIDGQAVKVGSIPHPMEEKHYIEWIEVGCGEEVCRKYLKPGDLPEAKFCLKDISKARIYCNIHGLWKS